MPSAFTTGADAEGAEMRGSIDIVFDGECGFCTRSAAWLTKLDRRGRIRLHPLQRPGVLTEFGISEASARAAVWVIDTDRRGRRVAYAGAAAVSRALDAALGTRVFGGAYAVPGVGALQDHVYRWVAEHRYLLRGVTPWCTTHPGECE